MQQPGLLGGHRAGRPDLGRARRGPAAPPDAPLARVGRGRPRGAARAVRRGPLDRLRARGSARPRSSSASRRSRRRGCSAAATTPATPWSPCARAPAAPIRRTGPRCSFACTCAGPSGAASGRDEGGLARRGGRAQVVHLHRPRRERLRPVRGRARRASPRPALALRRGPPPSHELCRGRRRPARRRRGRGGPRRGGPAGRHVSRLRRRRTAREQDRLRGPDHPHPHRDRRPVPERALAGPEQGDRDAPASRPSARARGAKASRGDGGRAGRAEGRGVGLADPKLRAASIAARQGPSHRVRGGRCAARARRRPRRLRARVPAEERLGARSDVRPRRRRNVREHRRRGGVLGSGRAGGRPSRWRSATCALVFAGAPHLGHGKWILSVVHDRLAATPSDRLRRRRGGGRGPRDRGGPGGGRLGRVDAGRRDRESPLRGRAVRRGLSGAWPRVAGQKRATA